MPFWTYMLYCRDRTFYVGHTDDLDVRLAQHQDGSIGGYTARKRPVKLVWSAELPTREEALAVERRVKGWRREKKMALIRGDWDEIARLAKGKGRPSTSSGRPEEESGTLSSPSDRPEPGEDRSMFLQRHSETPCDAASSIEVRLRREGDALRLRFVVSGDPSALRIPPRRESRRRDELWRRTCFELFAASPGAGYREFNFSPSTEWAAYLFDDYRTGMAPLAVEPQISVSARRRSLTVGVLLPVPPQPLRLNLAAVIEEKSGRKSYWALAHPSEGAPDFHDPACFVLELPPP